MKKVFAAIYISLLSFSALALPPEIEADRLLVQAKTALDASDYDKAIQSLAKAELLNVKMPETFYFHYGKAYSGAKKWDKAKAAYEKYLNQTGTRGKYYREALEGFNLADNESEKAEQSYANALKRYNEELARYQRNMDDCPDEYEQRLASAERDEYRLNKKCEEESSRRIPGLVMSCRTDMPSGPPAVAALRRREELSAQGADGWCKNRYTAPRKPERLP
jgi:tetratricopeptide (TPR) repeat protein